MKKIVLISTIIFLTTIITSFMSFSGAEDTQTQDDNYCYFTAKSVDVRVKVWPVDRRGNKGEKLWEGVIKKGEKKLIRTPDGRIRYAVRRNLGDDQLFSGDKSRWCQKGQEIGVP